MIGKGARRDNDTGDWLALAGFGLLGVGLSFAVRRFAGPGPFPANFRIGGYTTDAAWPPGAYADAMLAVTLSGLLAGALVLVLHRYVSHAETSWGRRLQLAAVLIVGLALLGLAAWRCFG